MRALDELVSQSVMMHKLDREVGQNVMVKAWYQELDPVEREIFDNYLAQITATAIDFHEVGRSIADGVIGGIK